MKENALLVRSLDIQKVYVDFSNIDNIYKILDAERLATIHTKETQTISGKLGIHLMGFATREGDDINNKRACEISGYDYIGSFMLLCKTDDKFNALPLDEAELECVYEYLTTSTVIPNKKLDPSLLKFMGRYGIKDPLLPNFELEPDVYYEESIPYMIYLRYDFNKANNDKTHQDMGAALFFMADRLVNEFQEENGVRKSPDGRYYINCLMDAEENVYHVLMQAVDEEDVDAVLIRDIKSNVRGFLGQNPEPKHVDMDTLPEEAGDIDDDESEDPGDFDDIVEAPKDTNYYDDEDSELANYVIEMEIKAELPESEKKEKIEGKYCYPLAEHVIDKDQLGVLPLLGPVLEISSKNLVDSVITVILHFDNRNFAQLELNRTFDYKLNYKKSDGQLVKGSLSITLKKYEIGDYQSQDQVVVEVATAEVGTIRKIKNREMKKFEVDFNNEKAELVGLSVFQVCVVNKECNYLVMANSILNEEGKIENIYLPVSKDEPNLQIFSFKENYMPYQIVTKIHFKRGLVKNN